MGAVNGIGTTLIELLFGLYLFVLVLRFQLQIARADFYNPISQSITKVTNPFLLPLRKFIPSLGRIDLALVFLGVIFQVFAILMILLSKGMIAENILLIPVWGFISLISIGLNIYFASLFVNIILSWFAPGSYNPAALLVHQIVQPIMKPIRAIIPPLGGLDFSPIFAFIGINIAKMLVAVLAYNVGLSNANYFKLDILSRLFGI
jgi:YggT family protein